jgi:DNA invertase Pin-like site-specific DNA recombinase
MLTALGALAEFDRDLIRTRTGEGRERAKARASDSDTNQSLPGTSNARRYAAKTGVSQQA